MKTAIAWIEYEKDGVPSISTCEYATIDIEGQYTSVKDFLDDLKNLAKTCGRTLYIKNVVIG